MSKKNSGLPKTVPTTGRTPDFLAKRYGFADLSELISDVPANGTVIDIGAGMSLLGHAVAAKRPDITWVNVDPYYKNPRYKKAAADAPKNVKYLVGDITNPSKDLLKIKADRIYSYWVLPHLSIHSQEPVRQAAGNMWDMLKPGGIMRLGPDYPYHVTSIGRAERYIKIGKNQNRQVVQQAVAKVTSLKSLPRLWHILQNNHLYNFQNYLVTALSNNQMRRARRVIH